MEKTKKGPRFLIPVQAAFMYAAHIPFFLLFVCGLFESDVSLPAGPLLGAAAVVFCLAALCGCLGLVLSLVQIRKKTDSPCRVMFIVKLILIPWYLFNFYYAFVFVGSSFNPFLMVFIPAEIIIAVCATWFLMVLTGMQDVIHALKALIGKRRKPSASLIVGMVLQFIFVADVAGAFLLDRAFRKPDGTPSEPDAGNG